MGCCTLSPPTKFRMACRCSESASITCDKERESVGVYSEGVCGEDVYRSGGVERRIYAL